MKKMLSVYLVLGSLFIAAGCECRTTEITGSSEYWGLYNPEQKYILIKDILIHKSKISDKPALFSDNSIKGLYEIPYISNVVENYKQNPELYKDLKVKGIAKAGTLLKLSRIIREDCPGAPMIRPSHRAIPYATILNGEFTNQEVSLQEITGLYSTRDHEKENINIYGSPDNEVIQPLSNKP